MSVLIQRLNLIFPSFFPHVFFLWLLCCVVLWDSHVPEHALPSMTRLYAVSFLFSQFLGVLQGQGFDLT